MKKVFLVLVLLFGLQSFAQESKVDEVVDKVEAVKAAIPDGFTGAIKPYVLRLLENVDNGVDFIITETPIVIRQYLYFEATRLWLIVFLGLGLITFIRISIESLTLKYSIGKPEGKYYSIGKSLFNKKHKWLREGYDATPEEVFYYFIKYFSLIFGVVLILVNTLDAIKVSFFPKLYLVEQFIDIVK
jgi:hypothetical protein